MTALPRLLPCYAFLLVLALAGLCAAPACAQHGAAPAEAFFSAPQLDDVTLSPSGRYLAALSGGPGRRTRLLVIDIQSNQSRVVAGSGEDDIVEFEWVNDDRLLLKINDPPIAPTTRVLHRLYAVNRDGSGLRQLSGMSNTYGSQIAARLLSARTTMLGQHGPRNSDETWVTMLEYPDSDEYPTTTLLRLNTTTGKTTKIAPPGKVDRWLLDDAGEPRLTVYSAAGRTHIHYLDPHSGKWRLLTEFRQQPGSKEVITPVGFGPDGKLYVRTYAGKDTASLYTLDPATGKLGAQPVVVIPGYDFDGELLGRPGKVLGVQVETDVLTTVWFDKDMQALQQAVDKSLPGTINQIAVADSPDAPWVRVRSFSDTRPPFYNLYSPGSGKLLPVGKSREGIDPSRMGRQETVLYKARDGLEISSLLTVPPGAAKKNLPLVLLVHDGPYGRGSRWMWDAQTQFLASRGYAVLEPDFRGSTGYGLAHYLAGWKQWGLAMQDDLVDGVRWAIAQGIADPRRVCIAGTGYGGYAALMGLARDPGVFRCGVARSGYIDLRVFELLRLSYRPAGREHYETFDWTDWIGDPVKDAARIKAASPVEQAGRIAQPVLLAYGAEDPIVPISDVRKLRDALLKNSRNVELAEYPDVNRRWEGEKHKVDYWRRVERFLDRHIGVGATPP